MKKNAVILFVTLTALTLLSCQSSVEDPSHSQSATETKTKPSAVIDVTATSKSATETPTITPTLISVSEKSLAGLIISSPVLGTPIDVPNVQPPEKLIPNGLGIINLEGELIKFSDAGLFESISPSGVQIAYQHGFIDEFVDYIDNLFIYNSMTGETIEILDDLENEGGKTIISWSQDEKKFFYSNDYLTVLFEAYGYFEPKQLLIADVETGETKLLITDGYQFDVNPDQAQIAYTTGEILDEKTNFFGGQPLEKFGCFQPHIYDVASSSSQPFDTSQLGEKPICVGYPKWSPDGKKIAWMGYFEDDTFRPIIFNLENKTASIYNAIDRKPESSALPAYWRFGDKYGNPEPRWIDKINFWTPSYEVNIDTDNTSTSREMDLPYNPMRNRYIKSLDGSLHISLNEDEHLISIGDKNGNFLTSYLLEDIYNGETEEIITNGFYLLGRTHIVGWSPFAPP